MRALRQQYESKLLDQAGHIDPYQKSIIIKLLYISTKKEALHCAIDHGTRKQVINEKFFAVKLLPNRLQTPRILSNVSSIHTGWPK